MNKVERDQNQVQALVPTNTQDLLANLCQIQDEIIVIY